VGGQRKAQLALHAVVLPTYLQNSRAAHDDTLRHESGRVWTGPYKGVEPYCLSSLRPQIGLPDLRPALGPIWASCFGALLLRTR